jgi:serine/threonine-protein kinase
MAPRVMTPDKLGKYTLRGTLGRGAMGTVYDGWDPAIDRRVAIKTVKLSDADDEETAEALARFKREAQAAGRLSHPNIVGVYDYGETDDLAYIVMEFVEGRSLKSLLDQEKRLPPPEAGTIMQQVLAGLGYSHARGVVHRDIKPANIMLTTEGQVKIADFGIARIESSSMTSVGTVMGTPAYMPPEQFLGEPVDARSDIYAAGVMLFHLLTGERPYEGSMTSIMQKVLSTDPAPRASSRASLPSVFDSVIAGAMAKAPADRYPSAGAFATALRTALETAEEEPDADATMVAPSARARASTTSDATGSMRRAAPPPPDPLPRAAATPAPTPAKKSGPPVALLGGLAAVILLGAGGAWFVLQPSAPKPPAVTAPVVEPPKPVTPPPAQTVAPSPPPKPTPEQALAKVGTVLAALPCTNLSAALDDGGFIAVSGLAGSGQAEQARTAADQAAGQAVTWQVRSVPQIYCTALEAVHAAGASLPLSMGGQSGSVHLTDGAPIVPRIGLPDFPSWLMVDYLVNDGSSTHLYPLAKRARVQQKPGSALTLTVDETGTVSPPYGTDMIIAVASAKPLLPLPRPAAETTEAYLKALASALDAARANGTATAAGVLVVETSKH